MIKDVTKSSNFKSSHTSYTRKINGLLGKATRSLQGRERKEICNMTGTKIPLLPTNFHQAIFRKMQDSANTEILLYICYKIRTTKLEPIFSPIQEETAQEVSKHLIKSAP